MGDKSPKQKNKQQRQKRDEKGRKAERKIITPAAPENPDAAPMKDKR